MMSFVIERRIDNLGRIVLPKDMRKYYGISNGDALEIVATEEGILIKCTCQHSAESNVKNQ